MKDIKNTDEKKLQKKLDVEKWLKSEQAGKDLCGTESFCAYCDKSLQNPCAKAVLKQTAAHKADPEKTVVTRYHRSFSAALIQNENAQKYYGDIKNALLSYGKTTSRVSFRYESFRTRGELIARLAVRGKSLYIFIATEPASVPEDVKFEDFSDVKSYADVPVKIKLSTKKAVKNAVALLDELAKKNSVVKKKSPDKEYKFSYRTDPELIAAGLIKPYTVVINRKKD